MAAPKGQPDSGRLEPPEGAGSILLDPLTLDREVGFFGDPRRKPLRVEWLDSELLKQSTANVSAFVVGIPLDAP